MNKMIKSVVLLIYVWFLYGITNIIGWSIEIVDLFYTVLYVVHEQLLEYGYNVAYYVYELATEEDLD